MSEQKKTEVFKVVRKIHGKYYSAVIRRNNGGLVYEIGKTTTPEIKNSPIMAFPSMRIAKSFACTSSAIFSRDRPSVLRCEGILSTQTPNRLMVLHRLSRSNLKKYWEGNDAYARLPELYWQIHERTFITPQNTVACREITPLEEVWELEI